MAKLSMQNTDDVYNALLSFGDSFGEVAMDMLKESAPILSSAILSNFPSEIEEYRASLYVSEPKQWKNGKYGVIFNFSGVTPRSKDNLRNAELMAYWEYGSSKNPPTGFLRKSVKGTKAKVQSKMAEVCQKKLTEAEK